MHVVPNELKKKCEKRVPYFIPCHRNECVAQVHKFQEGIFVKILQLQKRSLPAQRDTKPQSSSDPETVHSAPGRRDPLPVNRVS